MPLLLFLSAIFTALTGVMTGVRAPEVSAEQVGRVAAAVAKAVAAVPVVRSVPAQMVDPGAARLTATLLMRFAVTPIAPYTSRRRE